MKLSFSVSTFFYVSMLLGLFFTSDLQAQNRVSQQSTTSSGNGDDLRIKASRNTVPSSGHDKDLLVLRISGNHITTQPIKTAPNFNPSEMQTRQLNQGSISGDAANYSRKSTSTMAMRKEAPASSNQVALTRLKPLSKIISLTVLQPIVQGQASLLLKSPYEVNFISNEAMMYRSSAVVSFAVQKGKSYIVTAHTRMMPDKRSKQVSLNLNYAMDGENTAISLSKPPKSNSLEVYEFQVILEADGNGYINLNVQNEDNGGRWWFNKIEVQQVGY